MREIDTFTCRPVVMITYKVLLLHQCPKNVLDRPIVRSPFTLLHLIFQAEAAVIPSSHTPVKEEPNSSPHSKAGAGAAAVQPLKPFSTAH